jgi:SAM-dependent methyltransferase
LLAALPAGKARDYASIHERRLADTIAWLPQGSAGHAALELGTHHISMLPFLRDKGFAHVVGAQRGTDGGMSMRLWDSSTVEIHAFDAERPPFPFSDRCYDLVLCCEVLEHLTGDPMAMMTEINRVLKPGGMLLLTTPNIASARAVRSLLHGHWPYLDPAFNRNGSPDRHNLEYSPVELRGLMEAAGFEILRMETRDSWAPQAPEIVALLRREGHSTALRGDNIFLLAAKRTTYVRRFPAFLYGSGSNPGRLAETMEG